MAPTTPKDHPETERLWDGAAGLRAAGAGAGSCLEPCHKRHRR